MQVNEWYKWYEMEHIGKEVERRVFIATDEPSVLKEAETSYVYISLVVLGGTFTYHIKYGWFLP